MTEGKLADTCWLVEGQNVTRIHILIRNYKQPKSSGGEKKYGIENENRHVS